MPGCPPTLRPARPEGRSISGVALLSHVAKRLGADGVSAFIDGSRVEVLLSFTDQTAGACPSSHAARAVALDMVRTDAERC